MSDAVNIDIEIEFKEVPELIEQAKPGEPIPVTAKLTVRKLNKERGLTMNNDILQGKWKEMRGQTKEWWGKLTDSDLDRIGGKMDQLAGTLQKKYGYSREKADEEIAKRMKEYDQKHTKKA